MNLVNLNNSNIASRQENLGKIKLFKKKQENVGILPKVQEK